MSDTKNCASCGGCSGCASTLYMTRDELNLLYLFTENPFQPLGRKYGSEEPVFYLNDGKVDPAILTAMKLKGLITLDYTIPITNFDYSAYSDCDELGSMALTLRGQRVADSLEIQGIEE